MNTFHNTFSQKAFGVIINKEFLNLMILSDDLNLVYESRNKSQNDSRLQTANTLLLLQLMSVFSNPFVVLFQVLEFEKASSWIFKINKSWQVFIRPSKPNDFTKTNIQWINKIR